jgi:MraZ protein
VFRGISNLNADAKGRIAIPTKYRDEIKSEYKGEMILTVDHGDRCLALYPMAKWLDTEQTLMDLPNVDPDVRSMKRLILGYATDVEMDAQGRIVLPAPLRDYANMGKKIVMIGQGDKFELWDEESWGAGCDVMVKEAPINIQSNESLRKLSI